MISSCYSTASQMPHRCCPLATSVEYVDRRHVRACPSMSVKSCPGSPLNTRFPGPPTPYAKLHRGRFSCFCTADAAYSLYRPDMPPYPTKNDPSPAGDLDLLLTHVFLGPLESISRTACRSVRQFLHVFARPTHRHGRRPRNAGNNRPHLAV